MGFDRWDPFREMVSLRDAVDRLFQQSVVRPGSGLLATMRPEVPLDVVEAEREIVVRASLPGVRPEDIQVTAQGDTLTLRAEVQQQEEQPGESWVVREHRAGSISRTVSLPAPVNADAAQATYEHGVLTLRLPKAEEARPRRIPIGGLGGGESADAQAGGQATGRFSGSTMEGSAEARASAGPGASGGPASPGGPSVPEPIKGTAYGGSAAPEGQRFKDKVVDQSDDSFPASDPPSWTTEKA